MKILFLTQILPYPPDAGPKVKTWHVLRFLAGQGHTITLVSFVRAEEEKYLEDVRRIGIEVFPVPIRRSRIADIFYMLRSFLKDRPFLIERDDLPQMRRLVARLLSERSYDVLHADQVTMTQFAPSHPSGASAGLTRVFDAHNATWSIMDRMAANVPFFMRPLVMREKPRMKKYEGRIIRDFEHTLAVTEIDRQLLLEAVASVDFTQTARANEHITTIPIAVDTRQLQPVTRQPERINILTLGTLHYAPNADGIRWFINEVYPRVCGELPGVSLTVIGKNPPADFVQLAQQEPDTIQVPGYVEDLAPYFEKATLMVVPVRAGSGMRVRILEAFARAMPVVTTTIGLEGIDARPGEDVLVADTPADFAAEVLRLAASPALQGQLAANGRCLAEQEYDWHVVLKKLETLYSEAK